MKLSLLRQAVAEHARQAYSAGLFAGTSGNLSARHGDLMAITPSGLRYETLTAGDIVLVDISSGAVAEATPHRPSSETPLHLALYRARPDIGAVVHTHSPYATAFAAGGVAIPCALIEMVYFLGGDVPVAPLALPGTPAVGTGAVQALAHRHACLLQNHGVVAVGADLPQAYIRAEYAEDAAKICLLARQNGHLTEIEPQTIARMLGNTGA